MIDAQGASIKDLVEGSVLSPRFQKLCSEHLPYERSLYKHQEKAIRKAVQGRNLVVATGTGSGKTEAFLIPILVDVPIRELGIVSPRVTKISSSSKSMPFCPR